MIPKTETSLVEIIPAINELNKAEVILNARISSMVADYMILKVVDEQTLTFASDALTRVRTFLKRIEEHRKTHLQPLQIYITGINSKFSALKQPIEDAERHLTKEVQDYRQVINAAAKKEQERLQRLAERRVERAEAAGKPPPLPEAIAPLVPGAAKAVETEAGKVSFRTDWKAEIINPTLLPREYLMPDETKIYAVVRASKGTITIPGVKIYSVEVPVTRIK